MIPTFLLNPTFLMIAALGIGWGYTGWQLKSEKAAHATTKLEYSNYQHAVKDAAEKARLEKEGIEKQAREAADTVAKQHQKEIEDAKRRNAHLFTVVDSLRNQLSTFAAGVERDARAGDIAGLTARAATAGKLLDACTVEHRKLAEAAEDTRLQAVGLYDFIKRNPMCAKPFGSAAP